MIPKLHITRQGGVPASVLARISTLENNEYEVTYFEEFSSTTGQVTLPTGATIALNQFAGGVDAYVSTISSNQPTGQFPVTAGGVMVDVSSFDANGNFTLSGTPSAYPIGIIYVLRISGADFGNLDLDQTVEFKQTGFQPYDTELAALSTLTSAADKVPYFTGNGTASLITIVSAIRTLLESADVSTFRTNAGLAIGTNVQAYDATLQALAGITTAANKLIRATGSDTFDTIDVNFGVWTPTLTNGSNVAASTAYQCQWMRIGDIVICSGQFDLDPTSAGVNTILRMSFPVASNIGANEDAGGAANCRSVNQHLAVYGSVANDEFVFNGIPSSTANSTYNFIAQYRII